MVEGAIVIFEVYEFNFVVINQGSLKSKNIASKIF